MRGGVTGERWAKLSLDTRLKSLPGLASRIHKTLARLEALSRGKSRVSSLLPSYFLCPEHPRSSSLALTWQVNSKSELILRQRKTVYEPTSRSALHASTWPLLAAYMRGVYPPWLVSLGSAPGLPRR